MGGNRIIASFTYRHEAEYAQGFLRDAGIESLLLTDDAGGLHPGIGFSRSARIAVHADDADEALEVLTDAGVI
jgi:hypothetical protein